MLFLGPPFHIINRVTVFRDHEDPRQWYYLPGPPRVTQIEDTVVGVPVPQIQIIKFRGAAGSGGFLNFDVNLGVDPEVLDEIRDEIKRVENLRDKPRLAPVPLVDGTVKMMLFDAQTGEVPAEPNPDDLKFVLKLSHPAKPALYGYNQAAFSVQLTPAGVTVLERAMQGEMSPIGIVYSLDYLALRPAYTVKLNVDWDRVQKHLDETFGVDSIFFQSQITKAVDELIDNRAIDLQVDTFVPEGEDESLMGRRDQAVDEVREMITNSFFEPSLNPIEPEKEDTWDKLAQLAKTSSALAVTGGWGALVGFSYRKLDYTRIDRKTLNVNISERTTVKKTIYPQGHLSGLFRVLREPGIDLERFVLSVDIDDPWYAERRVHVISRADFTEDGITSLNVHLNYGGQLQDVVLDAGKQTADVRWNSLLDNGAMRREVTTRYKVTFADADTVERPLSLESPETVAAADNLEIMPRELYGLVKIPILALNFPWERYTHVELQTEYQDPQSKVSQADSFLLDQAHLETTWKMFVRDPTKTTFRYKVIYRAADHQDVEKAWVDSDEERLILRDPFPTKRTLEIVPVMDWTQIDRVFVDVSYEDRAHDVLEETSFEFNANKNATGSFTVALEDPNRRLIRYQVTIIHKNGSITEIPPSSTLDRRITVRGDMKGHQIISISPEQVDFASLNLRTVVVDTRYIADQTMSFADSFTFRSPADRGHFEYDYVDDGSTRYQYRIIRRFTNGLSRTTDWKDSSEGELVIPLR